MYRPRSRRPGAGALVGCRVGRRSVLAALLVVLRAPLAAAQVQLSSTPWFGNGTSGHLDGPSLTTSMLGTGLNGQGLAFAPNGTAYYCDGPVIRVIAAGATTSTTIVNGAF